MVFGRPSRLSETGLVHLLDVCVLLSVGFVSEGVFCVNRVSLFLDFGPMVGHEEALRVCLLFAFAARFVMA